MITIIIDLRGTHICPLRLHIHAVFFENELYQLLINNVGTIVLMLHFFNKIFAKKKTMNLTYEQNN